MSVTRIPAHFLLQYQSKCYYIIGQEVYYSIGRFITLSGSYYIIGRFLLHYRVLITVSGVITLSVGTSVMDHHNKHGADKNELGVFTISVNIK